MQTAILQENFLKVDNAALDFRLPEMLVQIHGDGDTRVNGNGADVQGL